MQKATHKVPFLRLLCFFDDWFAQPLVVFYLYHSYAFCKVPRLVGV